MKINTDKRKIDEILERGVAEVIDKEHIQHALNYASRSGKKLKIKFGIDPTSPYLHLGHVALLRKLRQFQNLGHQAILIIGDFTAQIGDPTGREDARRPLTAIEIKKNLKQYLSLAGKIIDIKKAKVIYNSKWLTKTNVIIELTRAGSIQQVMRREDFKNRIAAGKDITILETMYPLFQGYDSVAVNADIEIGGVDQKLNLLSGRKMQRYFGKPEQDILTMYLLIGTDGIKKMSKSFDNYIAINEKPNEMFVKIMSIWDDLVYGYALMLTDLDLDYLKKIHPQAVSGTSKTIFEEKKKVAFEIVSLLHSQKGATAAQKNFEKNFSKKETPKDLKIYKAKKGEDWINFLTKEKLVSSKSEAKRLVDGGAVDMDGKKIKRSDNITESGVVKIGKFKFIKIEVK